MTETLQDAALAAWEQDFQATHKRMVAEGQPNLTACVLAEKEVVARRGPKPELIAKALHDQGGPLAGQA